MKLFTKSFRIAWQNKGVIGLALVLDGILSILSHIFKESGHYFLYGFVLLVGLLYGVWCIVWVRHRLYATYKTGEAPGGFTLPAKWHLLSFSTLSVNLIVYGFLSFINIIWITIKFVSIGDQINTETKPEDMLRLIVEHTSIIEVIAFVVINLVIIVMMAFAETHIITEEEKNPFLAIVRSVKYGFVGFGIGFMSGITLIILLLMPLAGALIYWYQSSDGLWGNVLAELALLFANIVFSGFLLMLYDGMRQKKERA
jgi:hypothetical protein